MNKNITQSQSSKKLTDNDSFKLLSLDIDAPYINSKFMKSKLSIGDDEAIGVRDNPKLAKNLSPAKIQTMRNEVRRFNLR